MGREGVSQSLLMGGALCVHEGVVGAQSDCSWTGCARGGDMASHRMRCAFTWIAGVGEQAGHGGSGQLMGCLDPCAGAGEGRETQSPKILMHISRSQRLTRDLVVTKGHTPVATPLSVLFHHRKQSI